MSRSFSVVAAVAVLVLTGARADAQWFKLKTPNVPRTADGKLDTKAPAPRVAGKPDLSGLWRYDSSSYPNNLTVDLKPEEIAASATALYKQRQEDLGKDDPATFRCLPSGPRYTYGPQGWARIVQTPTLIAMIYEDLTSRQIFMDGRPLPKDPNPTHMGYSVGHWDGDTLVVDTKNFNDKILYRGAAENLHLVERITRVGPGEIDYRVTIDDPTTFTKQWTLAIPYIVTGEDMFEYACHEGNYGMEGILSGAREEEKAAAGAKK
jgi:hypothetical protein